jgi:hypothetical protein
MQLAIKPALFHTEILAALRHPLHYASPRPTPCRRSVSQPAPGRAEEGGAGPTGGAEPQALQPLRGLTQGMDRCNQEYGVVVTFVLIYPPLSIRCGCWEDLSINIVYCINNILKQDQQTTDL